MICNCWRSNTIPVPAAVNTITNMRELEATQNVLKKSLQRAKDPARIKNVYLVMGEVAELDQSLIEKHWQILSKGTPAEHARLHFRLRKAEVQCMACFSKYQPLDGKIHCPYCGSYGAKILSGEEFELESIELEPEET
jgi:hydrogenase nickel incorporation protein HypA/HybF